jgi:hypothetical protein
MMFWLGIGLMLAAGLVASLAGHPIIGGIDLGLALGLVYVWLRVRQQQREHEAVWRRLRGNGAG